MKIFKRMTTVREQREVDDLRATVAKQAAALEFVALMADVELPFDEENDGGIEHEQEN